MKIYHFGFFYIYSVYKSLTELRFSFNHETTSVFHNAITQKSNGNKSETHNSKCKVYLPP